MVIKHSIIAVYGLLALALTLGVGCTTQVRYCPTTKPTGVILTANTRVVATWTRTPDGGVSFMIDTSQQNWLDKARAGIANTWNWLGRRMDATPTAISK